MLAPEIEVRLRAHGIELLAEARQHYLFTRENCIALVERTATGLGSIGSTGLMLPEGGLVYLVWHEQRATLKGKAAERAATEEEIGAIRSFSSDLRDAIERA